MLIKLTDRGKTVAQKNIGRKQSALLKESKTNIFSFSRQNRQKKKVEYV
jgi:hypothetical protein